MFGMYAVLTKMHRYTQMLASYSVQVYTEYVFGKRRGAGALNG